MTTTTTPNPAQAGNNSGKSGDDKANASATAKAKSEANKKKQKEKKRQKDKDKRNNNNNNNNIHYVKHKGLISGGIMEGATINPGTSATMATEFRILKKKVAGYAASKGWEHLPQVVESMEQLDPSTWTAIRPDKNKYATKLIILIPTGVSGQPDIRKQEQIVTDCDARDIAEDNYSNTQRQKLTEHALYRKNSAALYVVLYGQPHSDIITIAKNSSTYTTMHKERDVVVLLTTLRDICIQHLVGTKVDPLLEQIRMLTSTLSYVQKKNLSNHDFGDAIYDQVLAAQSQCGTFAFGENYHLKVLKRDGIRDLIGYSTLTAEKRVEYDELAQQLICARLIVNNSLSEKTRIFLKEQFVVNQNNYPDVVVNTVAMITAFGHGHVSGPNNNKGGGGGNNNDASKTPEAIVSIHLTGNGDDSSDYDDGPVKSSESTEDDRGTDDGDIDHGAAAPTADSEERDNNCCIIMSRPLGWPRRS